ncbi:Ig-like domain repeat protein [Streptomyces actinomycinicus]|uniref:Ig-like domain repeat protein n=1 Tax=Streptomyces actinomycinicus TaxID=1695166 RepID=A0A937EGF1_9ACTN|nr:Ig-like domain repeat protein [Streptomyces actinomycinicus]MBL1081665.1 Ig-like domain repeat protein [Streptomyces actinomycinicus]
MRRTRSSAALVAAAVVAGGLALASPAHADPTPAGTFRKLVGVGSDTTQDVLNALAGDTVNNKSYADTAVKSASGAGIASYDAIEPGTGSTSSSVQTRSGGPAFLRPNGSGKGRLALSESLTGDKYPDSAGVSIKNQVDFARSSSGPSTSGTALTYIPFARDAVGVAVKGPALDSLTVDQLHDIYSGALTKVGGQTVHPKIPQSSSGTRKFFLSAIGLTDATLSPDIPTVQENQADSAITEDGALVPFSVGSWIAQNNGVAPDYSKAAAAAGAHLAAVQLPGDSGATTPVITVNGKLSPVTAYYENATFGRDVYNVVPSRAIDPAGIFYDKDLYDVFVTSGSHKAALASDAAEKVIADFGFVNEPYNGSVSVAKHAKLGGLEESGIDTSTPAKPGNLKAAPGDASLKLSWTAPAPTGLPLTDYRITLTRADGTVAAVKDVPAPATSYTFTGLADGTYTAVVAGANLNGTGAPATWTGAVRFASTTKATAATTAYGRTPKVTVTVTGSHGVAPTGKVTVKEGSTVLGTGALDGSGKASVALSNHLKVATHTLTVSYAGNGKLNASSTTATLKITKATPSVSSSAPGSISHTARAKVSVKVTATGTTPGGTVRIYEGSKVLATGTLSGGKVTVTLPKLSRGSHKLHAFYAGSSTVNSRSGADFTVKST